MKNQMRKWLAALKSSWNSKYYRKSFIIILFITSVPGIIVGSGIYFIGVKEVERELQDLHTTQIDTRAEHINQQLDDLENALSYWAFEPRFSTAVMDLDFISEFLETRDISRTLQTLQGSHPLVESVELFVDRETPVLFRPSYSVLTNEEAVESYQEFMETESYISWTSTPPGEEELENHAPYSLSLTHNIPGVSQPPYGVLVVNINQQALMQHLDTLTPYEKGATLMMDQEGDILLSSNDTEYSNIVSVLSEEVSERNGEAASFQLETEDEMFTVSTGTMTRVNQEWTYVSAAPISSITTPIVLISQVIVGGSLLIVMLAFIFTWLASRNIFRPIRKLSDQLSEGEDAEVNSSNEFEQIEARWKKLTSERITLQNKLSEQLPQLRQNFLQQLMKGYLYNLSEEELRTRMGTYRWPMVNRKFVVIDIQLTGLHQSPIAVDKDENLVTFSSMNIVEEVGRKYFSEFSVLNHYDLSLSIFINYESGEKEEQAINEFAEECIAKINELTEMRVTVTLSRKTAEAKVISHLFEEVSQGKRYRKFENDNQLIDLSKENQRENEEQIYYPFETEKEIIQSLRRGELEETESLIKRFVNEIIEKGVHEINIQPGMIQLYGKIQHEILHTGIHPGHLFDGRNLLEELQQIRERGHMVDWIMNEVIKPFMKVMEGKMNIETKREIEEVLQYIHEHYHEDISLESSAEAVQTNPYTLSKAFKRIQGVNFIDYLTELRIEEAKKLISQTDLKMNEIAEKVGYRNSYFNRIFKKQVGMPPGQYRKLSRKEEG